MSTKKTMGVVAGALVTAAALSASADGATQTLFSSNGFEPSSNPNFNYRSGYYLQGQPFSDGALLTPPMDTVPTSAKIGMAQSDGKVTAQVATYSQIFGSNTNTTNTQLVYMSSSQLSSTSLGSYFSAGEAASPFTPTGGSSTVNIVFSLSVAAASAGDPLFGVVAYDGNGKPLGEILVDSNGGSTGKGQVIGGGTTPTFSPTLGLNNINDYELSLNYATQTSTLYYNNGGTFTPFSTAPFLNPGATFGYGALTSFAATGTTTPATGQAIFDNLTITAVPEPTTASVLLGGVAVTGLRRRRSGKH